MKYFLLFFLLLFLMLSFFFTCDFGLSSTNRPYQTDTDRIDTTNIKHLNTPMFISFSVNVNGYNKATGENVILDNAKVYVFNNDSVIYTDTSGNATTEFIIDSIPYKYGYKIEKETYTTFNAIMTLNWDTSAILNHSVTLKK